MTVPLLAVQYMEQEMWIRLSELQVAPLEMLVFLGQGWDFDVLVISPVSLCWLWFSDPLLGLVH